MLQYVKHTKVNNIATEIALFYDNVSWTKKVKLNNQTTRVPN